MDGGPGVFKDLPTTATETIRPNKADGRSE